MATTTTLTTVTERRAAALLSVAAAAPARVDASADDEDDRYMRRKATVSTLTRTRLNALVPRLAALVAALDRRLRVAEQAEAEEAEAEGGGEAAAGGGDVAWTQEPALTAAQMLEKLAFVADAAADELRAEEGEADAVDWSPLLVAVMGGEQPGDALSLWEGDEAARALDAALDAELECEAGDDARLEAVQAAVTRYLRAVLVAPVAERGASASARDAARHSLRQLLSEFRGVFTTCYKPFIQPGHSAEARRGSPDASGGENWPLRLTSALPLAAADVLRFAGLLTQVLRVKHALLRDSRPEMDARLADVLRRLVLDALFDALQHALHELVTAVFSREDTFLGDVAYLSRASPPSAFGVREALRLDGTWAFQDDGDALAVPLYQLSVAADEEDAGLETEERVLERRRRQAALSEYSGALFWLDSMSTSSRAPSEKLRRLVRACREAREAPAVFYAKQWGARCQQRGRQVEPESGDDAETLSTPEALAMSPADMHALLGFLLSASPSTNAHAFSHLAILRIFDPFTAPADAERSAAVAALEGAVQRMMPSA